MLCEATQKIDGIDFPLRLLRQDRIRPMVHQRHLFELGCIHACRVNDPDRKIAHLADYRARPASADDQDRSFTETEEGE